MKKMEIAYKVGDGLYINLTNKCSSACTFCLRHGDDKVGESTYKTNANNSEWGRIPNRKFQGFYTPKWSEAAIWKESDVSGIPDPEMPGKPSLSSRSPA